MFFLFIKCIGMTLVNKIVQVSGAQLHNTSTTFMVCPLPQVESPSITIYLPNISSTCPQLFLPPAIAALLSMRMFTVLVCECYHNKVPQFEWLYQQKFVCWVLEAKCSKPSYLQNGQNGFLLPCPQVTISLRLHIAFSLCVFMSTYSFLTRTSLLVG